MERLTLEQKVCRIKSLRLALGKLQIASNEGISRRDLFLRYPHPMTGGAAWQTGILEKLAEDGLIEKTVNGNWRTLPSGRSGGLQRSLGTAGLARLLGFSYVDEASVAPNAVAVPNILSVDESEDDEEPIRGDPEEAQVFGLAETTEPIGGLAELPEHVVANIEYIREVVADILDTLTKLTAAALSDARLTSIEQSIQVLQKDVALLTKHVKVVLSQRLEKNT